MKLRDFKAFHFAEIELRPLTVFVGENNSGKSSITAAIKLLAQTIQNPDSTIPALFSGPFGDYGSYRDIVHNNHRARPFEISITVPSRGTLDLRSARRRTAGSDVCLRSEFKYRTGRRETVLQSSTLSVDGRSIIGMERKKDADRPSVTMLDGKPVLADDRTALRGFLMTRNFIPRLRPYAVSEESTSAELYRTIRKLDRLIRVSANSIDSALASVESIGSMRVVPERTFVHSGVRNRRIGSAGENWGTLLALGMSARSKDSYVDKVSAWLRSSGIAESIEVSWLSDRHFEILIQHPITREKENVFDVGRGTSHVLPVILGGYRLPRGSTYLVEEPESHLHPRAQAALGDFFADLIEQDVQAIVETHSEYLLMRLQQHVAAGRIDPSSISIYYVNAEPDGKKNCTN
ncbi:ATP-binding protein [Rhodococcus fascians]|nr:ATP-binding protein [Rhodococcus fascians]MBY4398554.1 ATP-binding protein [Rhodococcus fascians]MBY4408112.1 ATP-binding protein [Rhodococcus fascians]MBY4420288.1 ATP-binding protein [Rhodococcus fascians]MBY4463053.1 ATP-binding protein [Rhodococcus fascians]